MEREPVIICNPGYGNGPYLRCAELAHALRNTTGIQLGIVVPLIYGENQKRILREEMRDANLIFDETLGKLIASIAYEGKNYTAYIERWHANVDRTSEQAQKHIQSTYGNIAMEIARSPLLELDIHPSYCTLFARTSDILNISGSADAICDRMRKLENHFDMRYITEPGTFPKHDATDTPIPMTASLKSDNTTVDVPSIYVTTSGIPDMNIAQNIELPCYTNTPQRIPHASFATPHVLAHPNIVLHIARSGWGSVWMSLLTETPLIVLPYHRDDDPEIALNNKRVVELGIGIMYENQSTYELLEIAESCKQRMRTYKQKLLEQFGTLDGASYAAERIAKHWLNQTK